jgi:molecular chaperone GrpE
MKDQDTDMEINTQEETNIPPAAFVDIQSQNKDETEIEQAQNSLDTETEIPADYQKTIEELQEEIERLKARVEQEHSQYLRTLAEFQNFRRRSEEQRLDISRYANSEIILGLLPVLDNFERALAASEKSQSFEALINGVTLTMRQIQDFLKKNGVEQIESVGKEFDPNLHEAIARVEDGEHPENTVVDEHVKGYMLHDRVIRPAQVRVAVSK